MSMLGRITVDAWRKIDEEWIERTHGERFDWRPLVALVTVAVALTFWYYYSGVDAFFKYFPDRWRSATGLAQSQVWTTAVYVGSLVLVPLLVLAAVPGQRAGDYLRASVRVFRRMWPYLFLIAIALPGILLLTDSHDVIKLYPFKVFTQREPANRLVWLALVAVQMLSVEFFFRCFLLRALTPRFGSSAIFAMIVPYSMLLYGNPVKESALAIVASVFFSTAILRDASLLRGSKTVTDKGTAASPRELPFVLRWLRELSIGSWRHIDNEWIEPHRGKAYDWRPLIVLGTVAISLLLQETYGDRGTFQRVFPERMAGDYGVLESFAWWSGWRVFGYVILPVIAICLMPGERVRDYFISFKNLIKHLWIYLGLFALVLPAVLISAQSDSFLRTYPFYKLANRSAFDFWAWQALYAVQFLSLEFFFRGFILKATAPRLGSGATFVMVVPYCMIHFGKPMAETIGAIIAGTVLGTLALRTRSIWGGVLIHVGVAVTMDLLAVSQCPPADSGLQCPRH